MKAYICNPKRNHSCKKTVCQDMRFRTLDKAKRARGLTALFYLIKEKRKQGKERKCQEVIRD